MHYKCHGPFVDYKRLNKVDQDQASSSPKKQKLCSASSEYNWKENFSFCKSPVISDGRHLDRNKDSQVVRKIPQLDSMLSKSRDCLDSWAKQVKGRLENCIDPVVAEAKLFYHKFCHACFCSSKDLNSPSEKRKSLGQPQKHSMLSAFNNLCDWLQEEVELYTLGELHKQMTQMTENENEDVYSMKRLKEKLQDHYRDHLFFY